MFRLIPSSYKLLLQLKEQKWFNAAEKRFVESTVDLCFMFIWFTHKPTVNTWGSSEKRARQCLLLRADTRALNLSLPQRSLSLWHVYHLQQCTECMFIRNPDLDSPSTLDWSVGKEIPPNMWMTMSTWGDRFLDFKCINGTVKTEQALRTSQNNKLSASCLVSTSHDFWHSLSYFQNARWREQQDITKSA